MAWKAREELAAHDAYPALVSRNDLKRLSPWKVDRIPTLVAPEALGDALASASEERPMQVVLEKHPSLLAHTITGNHGTWVRPQVQFGNHYMADFLIAGYTSGGLRWTLVELESPIKRLTNPGNGRASLTLRHAIDQIEDWRRWLATNLAYARASREDGGLTLPGITADARGLIIIGRDDIADAASHIRDLQFKNSRIEVRTYDWLVRAAEESLPLRWGLLNFEIGEDDGQEPYGSDIPGDE
ncbi:Shedu anti-phage system protein SduA domain-containing protein [Nonomuraea bangladeshensis]